MKRGHRPQPPPEPSSSRAATVTKRKHHCLQQEQSRSSKSNSNSRHAKRCRTRIVSESETLTVVPDPPRTLPASNRFERLHSSSTPRGKQRHKKSSARDCNNRQWVSSSCDTSNCEDKVVVVSYNILGVENALKHPDLYYKVPCKFLDWDRRKILICEEINHYNASILCFQEVDRFDDLDNLFQNNGFKGVYKARTGEAYDGCAIFWKDKLFTLLHQENIEFRSFALRDNVAQLCVLEMIQNQSESELYTERSMSPPTLSRRLLVGNIHVLFNPNRGDIKLGQVRIFLERAYELSQEWGDIPVVIGGDLNSLPQSAIYQFVASSKLDIHLHDRRKISGQLEYPSQCRGRFQNQNPARYNVLKSISRSLLYRWSDEERRLATGSGGATHVQHQLKLSSAYHGVPGSCRTRDNHGEPLATSYHSKFMGTVDYIWHTDELVPVRALETLPIDILRRSGGLPKMGQRSSRACMRTGFCR
ncbi:carbon catabolite repressor protein 4 homolog 5 isoform X2 [Corylus avellana]|uniref:carbon catabolite repressor protein 4 homolog 5 isoform X2 n=1 Tax=Corylus avellana TaxID=13451 RepID=UPI00286CF65C|nr:carbon catabolite repressor protein 4 homolog 5 isoform X2 [Corylus avellana]